MRIGLGIDLAEKVRGATAIAPDGVARRDRTRLNTPTVIMPARDELATRGGPARVGLDDVAGIAGLAKAMLAEARLALVHALGLAGNQARQGTTGGENKADPRDACTLAEQVRPRPDLQPRAPATKRDLAIGLLVGRSRDLGQAPTQRRARRHDRLAGIVPGLERALDLTTKRALCRLTRFVTPAERRTAGRKRLAHPRQAAGGLPNVALLADRALTAAAARLTAWRIRELAAEAPARRARRIALDRARAARRQRQPCGSAAAAPARVRRRPGMGAGLTAARIAAAGNLARCRSADAVASAAGMAPVRPQSGRTRVLRWPTGGNQGLERVLDPSVFDSLGHHAGRAFHDRQRREGKRHRPSVVALARRRVNVLWASVHARTPFQAGFKRAA
jgi:hypothetical protein